jgi:hypothetical protein
MTLLNYKTVQRVDMEKYNAMIVVQFFAANNYVEKKHHVSK